MKKNSCVPQDQPSIDEYLLAKPLKPTTKRPFNDETGVKAAKVPDMVSGAPMNLASRIPVYNVNNDVESSSGTSAFGAFVEDHQKRPLCQGYERSGS